ncbi:hypothetical protein ACOME3_001406 [Neoechinorhynchus agilis]
MFENLIVFILEKYLGDYVENLDTKNLRVALWSGNVELDNLKFKAAALGDIGLPITVRSGFLKKLRLRIPWKNIYGDNVKVEVEGLYLLIVPKSDVVYDNKKEEAEKYECKMRKVKQIETIRKEREALSERSKTGDASSDTFIERLQMQIIRNLDLNISDVHIRFEDRTSSIDTGFFSFGINLSSIVLKTTNQVEEAIVPSISEFVLKEASMIALSAYWDSLDRSDFLDSHPTDCEEHDYILEPMDIRATLRLLMKPHLSNFMEPMVEARIHLGELTFNLNKKQYCDCLNLLKNFDVLSVKYRYLKYRQEGSDWSLPTVKWRYAFDAVINDQIRPRRESWKWTSIKEHRQNLKEYRRLFVASSVQKSMLPDDLSRMRALEMKLDVFNLTLVRSSAHKEVSLKLEMEKQKESWSGWIRSFWVYDTNQDGEKNEKFAVTSDDLDKLYDAIGYAGSDTTFSTYPPQYIQSKFKFELDSLKFAIWWVDGTNEKERFAYMDLCQTIMNITRRPASSALRLDLGVKKISLHGRNRSSGIKPVLISSNIENMDDKMLFSGTFEINPVVETNTNESTVQSPLESTSYKVTARLSSLVFTYDYSTINTFIQFLLAPKRQSDSTNIIESVRSAAYSTLRKAKHRTRILLKHNLESLTRIYLDIYICSSCLIVPNNGIYDPSSCSTLRLDFGDLTILTNDTNAENECLQTESLNMSELYRRSYSWFDVILQNVQLLFIGKQEVKCDRDNKEHYHLIEPITLSVHLGKCLYIDEANLAQFKVIGNIPILRLVISECQLQKAWNDFKDFPLPNIEEPTEIADEDNSAEESMMRDIEEIPIINADDAQNDQTRIVYLLFDFLIDRLEVLIRKRSLETNVAFLELFFQNLSAYVEIQSFQKVVRFSLDDMSLIQKRHNADLMVLLVDSKSSLSHKHTSSEPERLITTEIEICKQSSNILIRIAQIHLNLQQEALRSIWEFKARIFNNLSPIQSSDDFQVAQPSKPRRKSTPLKWTLTAQWHELMVSLSNSSGVFLDMTMNGLRVNATNTLNDSLNIMTIKIILGTFKCIDPTDGTLYRKILCPQESADRLFEIDALYRYDNNSSKEIDDRSILPDCEIKANLVKLEFSLVFRVISQTKSLIDEILGIQSSLDESLNAAYSLVKPMGFKISLCLSLSAPIVFFPETSRSTNCFLFDFGEMFIQTSFKFLVNNVAIEEHEIKMMRLRASRIGQHETVDLDELTIMNCDEMKVYLRRRISGLDKDAPPIAVEVQCPAVESSLSKGDFCVFMRSLRQNINEEVNAPIMPIDTFSSFTQTTPDTETNTLVSETFESFLLTLQFDTICMVLYSSATQDSFTRSAESRLSELRIERAQLVYRSIATNLQSAGSNVEFVIENLVGTDRRQSVPKRGKTDNMRIDKLISRMPSEKLSMIEVKIASRPSIDTETVVTVRNPCICMSVDYIFTLQDFFISGIQAYNEDFQPTQQATGIRRDTHTIGLVRQIDVFFQSWE